MFDTGKSILDSLKERFTSPFSAALIISWLLWNIKAVLILLFDQPDIGIVEKLDLINQLVYCNGNPWKIAFFVYILPIISAFIIVWLYPYVSNLAHAKSTKYKVEKHNKTVELEGKLTLTYDEIDELKTKWDDKIKKLREENNIKDDEIENLKDEINSLRKNINVTVSEETPKEEFVTDAELFLRKIEKEYDINKLKEIFNNINNNRSINTDDEYINLLVTYLHATPGESSKTRTGYKKYNLTESGQVVYKQLLNNELVNYKNPSSKKNTKKTKEEKIVEKIINQGYKDYFDIMISKIAKEEYINLNEKTDFFLKLGIVGLDPVYVNTSESARLKYTDLGLQVREYYAINY